MNSILNFLLFILLLIIGILEFGEGNHTLCLLCIIVAILIVNDK